MTFLFLSVSIAAAQGLAYDSRKYVEVVKRYADFAIQEGRDRYGPNKTKLFVDGVEAETNRPVEWILASRAISTGLPKKFIMLNFANQQNLLRMLVGLSELTGEVKYQNAAAEAVVDAFKYLQGANGLLYWGGEALWSADTDQPIAYRHEFKGHFPFYDLLWRVNPRETEILIRTIWASHVHRWDILEFDRHARWDTLIPNHWEHSYDDKSKVPFVSNNSLTFMATGIDMVYAAAHIYKWTEQEKPLLWAKRLAKRYVDSRNPSTGLGPAQYNTISRRRVENQFRRFNASRPPNTIPFTEVTVTDLYKHHRYTMGAAGQLWLADTLGEEGTPFLRWAIQDLSAYARHAYEKSDNSFWASLIDGTRLTPDDYESHKGYRYVRKRWLEKLPATTKHFWLYAFAYRLTGDKLMWEMARNIARSVANSTASPNQEESSAPGYVTSFDSAANALGDIGKMPNSVRSLNFGTENSDYHSIFGLIELYQATKDNRFLDLAEVVAENAIKRHLVKSCFAYSQNHINCDFNYPLPLALLHLAGILGKMNADIPKYVGGWPYFHGFYRGKGRVYDRDVVFDQKK